MHKLKVFGDSEVCRRKISHFHPFVLLAKLRIIYKRVDPCQNLNCFRCLVLTKNDVLTQLQAIVVEFKSDRYHSLRQEGLVKCLDHRAVAPQDQVQLIRCTCGHGLNFFNLVQIATLVILIDQPRLVFLQLLARPTYLLDVGSFIFVRE